MNLRKSVHILLATLLCFGQLVASAHIVGHYQLHSSPSQPEFNLGHAHVHASAADHHHDNTPFRTLANAEVAVAFAEDEKAQGTAENDCSIYHVFLSLGGVVSNNVGDLSTLVSCAAISSYSDTYNPHFLLGHTRIRAPPTIS